MWDITEGCIAEHAKVRDVGRLAVMLHAEHIHRDPSGSMTGIDSGWNASGAVEEERARRLAAARAYAEELDTLEERPSSTWPASVRALVKQRESAAAEVRP